MYRHENVAIKIFTVMPNAENNFTVSGPDVATMSLPGKAPLNVTNDSNAAAVHIDLRPFLSRRPITLFNNTSRPQSLGPA